MLVIPEVVANRARSVGADRWMHELPDLVDELARRWTFTLGEPFDEGTEAYVAAVTRVDGTPAILKVLVPRRDGGIDDHEAVVLRLDAARGCPMLYEASAEHGALLMERLGPSMFALGLPYERRLPALCDAAARIWRAAPDAPLPTTEAKANWLIEFVTTQWAALDRPCAERTVEHAITCASRRRDAHDPDRRMLLHGDVHQWNALHAGDGFKLVDPDGLVGEPEYDLGVVLREDPDEPLAADTWATARWMADRYDLDFVAIWEWAVIERVSTGLVATEIDLQPVGRELLAFADRLAAAT